MLLDFDATFISFSLTALHTMIYAVKPLFRVPFVSIKLCTLHTEFISKVHQK